MKPNYLEWLKQADYDVDTAAFMYSGKRFFYTVFMCHLSVEKALKGLYQKTKQKVPPKTHNQIYLLTEIAVQLDEKNGRFVARLNEANIAARYPETIEKVQSIYTQEIALQILNQTREFLEWIKQQY